MGTKTCEYDLIAVKAFRYLQGYMGTSVADLTDITPAAFRYLQGYMGTTEVRYLSSGSRII